MSKLYFPNVYRYTVSENLLLISWQDSFECFDFEINQSLFKIGHRFFYCTVINGKIWGQIDNEADILVYDLSGKLVQTISGQFYLWRIKLDEQFLFISGINVNGDKVGFKIDTLTFEIVATLPHYKRSLFVKNDLGFDYLGNEVYCYNIFTGNRIWTYNLGTDITPDHRSCYLNNDNVIVSSSDSQLRSLHMATGECLWQQQAGGYQMHPVNKNLYRFGRDLHLKIRDSITGELIFSKEYPEIREKSISYFGQSEVLEDGLYFYETFGPKAFGKINLSDYNLEFVMDVVDMDRGNRILVPTFPHRNCFFVTDYNYNVHVYKRLTL